jgi:hypothetical protein
MYHMPERGKEKEGKRHRTYQPHLQIDDRDDRTPHAKPMACKWLAVFLFRLLLLAQGQESFFLFPDSRRTLEVASVHPSSRLPFFLY